MPRYLLDAVLLAPGLTVVQLKIVVAVIRLTWGYFPEKNRYGAEISRKTLAKRIGLKKRTLDKAMPPLIREGLVCEAEPPRGRRAPVIGVNHDPASWGRFTPVEYADGRTLSVECDEEGTQAAERSDECAPDRTQSATAGVPRVRREGHSTASPSPSSLSPSSLSPSSPQTPHGARRAEGHAVGGFDTDPSASIDSRALQAATRRFLDKATRESR